MPLGGCCMLLPTKRGSRCDWLLADIQICEYGVAAFSGNDQGIQVTNWKAWNPPIQQPCNSTLYHYQPCHHQHHCPHDSKMSKVYVLGGSFNFIPPTWKGQSLEASHLSSHSSSPPSQAPVGVNSWNRSGNLQGSATGRGRGQILLDSTSLGELTIRLWPSSDTFNHLWTISRYNNLWRRVKCLNSYEWYIWQGKKYQKDSKGIPSKGLPEGN